MQTGISEYRGVESENLNERKNMTANQIEVGMTVEGETVEQVLRSSDGERYSFILPERETRDYAPDEEVMDH